MKILKDFIFFDEKSKDNISKELINIKGSTLHLTVYGTEMPALKVEQLIDIRSNTWQENEIIISKAPLDVIDSISKFGAYDIPIDGARKIRIVNNKPSALGLFTVFGNTGE